MAHMSYVYHVFNFLLQSIMCCLWLCLLGWSGQLFTTISCQTVISQLMISIFLFGVAHLILVTLLHSLNQFCLEWLELIETLAQLLWQTTYKPRTYKTHTPLPFNLCIPPVRPSTQKSPKRNLSEGLEMDFLQSQYTVCVHYQQFLQHKNISVQ